MFNFKRQKSVQHLSANELKSKLYDHFHKTGSINRLRTQLRSQLASELFKLAPPETETSENNHDSSIFDRSLLPLQVCNWLIYDHLLRHGYQYALSTFVSETNLPYPDKLLTARDILGLFGLENSAEEYKKISEIYLTNNQKGALHSLLLAIIKSLCDISNKDSHHVEKQSDKSFEEEVDRKLLYDNIKQHNKKYYRDSETIGAEVSKTNKVNVDVLLESSMHEQIQYVKEEKEKEVQKLRHKLLQELDRLHSQERSGQLELEQERKEIKRERDLLFNERNSLKDKEKLFVKEQENKLEKKLREIEELNLMKLHSKEKDIEMLNKKLLDTEQKLEQVESELSSHKERFDSLKQELEDMNHMYRSIHEKYNSLLDENTNLLKKFEKMSDYNILKEEVSNKSKEILNLQQEIENIYGIADKNKKSYTETVTNLELKLRAAEPKLNQVQRELNLTRDTLHMEEAAWEKEKRKLEQESLTSKELYRTVLQKIEEQKQDIQDLHQTIHILHYQLTSKDTGYSEKLVLSDPRITVPKVSLLPSREMTSKYTKSNSVNLSQKYKEEALSFTTDCKNRLHKIQQEVEASFDKYSSIYYSSLEGKSPKSELNSVIHKPSTFTHSMKLGHALPTNKLSNILQSNVLKNKHKPILPSKNLNLRIKNVAVRDFLSKYDSVRPVEKTTFSPNLQNHKNSFSTSEEIDTNLSSLPHRNEKIQPGLLTQKDYKTSYSTEANSTKFYEFGKPHSELIETNNSIVNQGINVCNEGITEGTHHTFCSPQAELVKDSTILTYTSSLLNTDCDPVPSIIKFKDFSDNSSNARENSQKEIYASNTLESPVRETPEVTEDSQTTSLIKEQDKCIEETTTIKQSTVADAEETVLIENQPNVVVDLDAAWKRKTSLPPISPPLSLNSDLLKSYSKSIAQDKQNEENNQNQISHLQKEEQDIFLLKDAGTSFKQTELKDINKSNVTTQDNSNEYKNIVPPITVSAHTDKYTSNESRIEISDNIQYNQKLLDTECNEKKDSNYQTGESNKSKLSTLEEVGRTDDEVKETFQERSPANSGIKQTPEDSLSELSEVHMSYGSEQEEQKEESDNW